MTQPQRVETAAPVLPVVGDASLRFVRYVVAECGVETGSGLVTVALSVRQLAERVGKSPGTVSRYMAELESAGIRVAVEDGKSIFDVAVLASYPKHSTTTPLLRRPVDSSSQSSAIGDALRALADVAAAAPNQLATIQALALDLLAEAAGTEACGLGDECAGFDGTARTTRAPSRGVFAEKEGQNTSNEGMNTSFIPSNGLECAREQPRSARTRAEFELLLAPLVKASQEAGLQSATHMKGLADQWSMASNEHLCFAVARLSDEVRAGFRKPFGKLFNVRHDPDYNGVVAASPEVVMEAAVPDRYYARDWVSDLADIEAEGEVLDRHDVASRARGLRDHFRGDSSDRPDES